MVFACRWTLSLLLRAGCWALWCSFPLPVLDHSVRVESLCLVWTYGGRMIQMHPCSICVTLVQSEAWLVVVLLLPRLMMRPLWGKSPQCHAYGIVPSSVVSFSSLTLSSKALVSFGGQFNPSFWSKSSVTEPKPVIPVKRFVVFFLQILQGFHLTGG